MVKPYISWSELSCFLKNENEYYKQYIMGVKIPQTKKMLYGHIIHQAIEMGGLFDLEEELKKKFFTQKDIRIAKELVKVRAGQKKEVKLYIEDKRLACGLYIILDGLDIKPEVEMLEYKTTGSAWKDQSEVDESGQLTLYFTGMFVAFNIMPKLSLYRLDTGNGKIKQYITTRNEVHVTRQIQKINDVVGILKARGWWDRRQTKSLDYLEEAKHNTQWYAKVFDPNLLR